MERDRRGLRLSVGSAILTLLAFIVALITATSASWATIGRDTNFGPWKACQGTFCSSTVRGSSVVKTTWASLITGTGSVACTILLGVAMLLSPIIVTMHTTQSKVFIKFRHATLAKMVCTAAAAFCSVISLVCWVLEALVFVGGSSAGASVSLGWAFYIQILVVGIGWGVGALSGLEWTKSRKLGGDPTVYGRDPEGNNAITIANPSVADKLENGTKPANGSLKAGTSSRSSGRSHRNSNGVAMTRTSGQPYMIQPNGHANGRTNGSRLNGGPHQYDPKAIPLRSSLRRKPKPQAPTSGEDTTDTSTGIQNPAFQSGSPTLKKKTVRIHTQSTAV